MRTDDIPITTPVAMTQAVGWWALIDTEHGLTKRRVAVFTTAWFSSADGKRLEPTPVAWVPYDDTDQLAEASHVEGFYGLWHEDEPRCGCFQHPGMFWCPDCHAPNVG